ncbi:MAG: glycoside hydrolase family 9 protein [Spirochaetaceae bacterium]|nr:glycoside hydrolase family 9 protein [Spirochaetaceae bacterium]
MNNIFVNQIGFLPQAQKTAVIEACFLSSGKFSIKNESDETVFEGTGTLFKNDALSGGDFYLFDFSAFTGTGIFHLVSGKETSPAFKIADNVYNDLFYSILRYFSLSRCGEQINDKDWGHKACHTGKTRIYGTTQYIEASGGWHDAGDYGRYVVAGSKTIMDLLLAYEILEQQGTLAKLDFDILDEVRFELEWFLKLQRADGAVYHKVSCAGFCGFIPPENEEDELIASPVSTAATADFAGCLAFAYSFFLKKDREFAEKLLEAAKKAQNFLDINCDIVFDNPPGISTGTYGDRNLQDERYFALCSLFGATKDQSYLEKALYIRNKGKDFHSAQAWTEAFNWGSVAGYGSEILLKNEAFIKDKSLIEEIKQYFIEHSKMLLAKISINAFNVAITNIPWGSNGYLMDEVHAMKVAYDITKDADILKAAELQLNYLLGNNPNGYCYVTGFGTKPVVNPHHRQSAYFKRTMPGMLAGGPCAGLLDAAARKHLAGKAPLQCYIDHNESYSTNEIAIYWNSPLVLALAWLYR